MAEVNSANLGLEGFFVSIFDFIPRCILRNGLADNKFGRFFRWTACIHISQDRVFRVIAPPENQYSNGAFFGTRVAVSELKINAKKGAN